MDEESDEDPLDFGEGDDEQDDESGAAGAASSEQKGAR
jgi:hypothetical protein